MLGTLCQEKLKRPNRKIIGEEAKNIIRQFVKRHGTYEREENIGKKGFVL